MSAAKMELIRHAVRRYLAAETPGPAGLAMAECGDVLRIRGDYSSADDAYRRAVGFGHDPQPGLAVLWLAWGRTDAAASAAHRLLAEPRDPIHRLQLLPGAVEILLSAGAVGDAAALADELVAVAVSFGIAAVRAIAGYAHGSVLMARGESSAAIVESIYQPSTTLPRLVRDRDDATPAWPCVTGQIPAIVATGDSVQGLLSRLSRPSSRSRHERMGAAARHERA
jgi:hypothetical protein